MLEKKHCGACLLAQLDNEVLKYVYNKIKTLTVNISKPKPDIKKKIAF
jgi:hypothetical protein